MEFNNTQNFLDHTNCLIIAEIGLAHEGSLGIAFKMIDKCYKCGVDAVKFQTHLAKYESSTSEKFRTDSFIQDQSRFDYWDRTSFTKNEWLRLKNYTENLGLKFLSTPFSLEAAKMLDDIGIEFWKISSGDINNFPLLDFVKSTKKPVFISTGMSDYDEIEKCVEFFKKSNTKLLIFQCTNSYPCPPELIGFDQIKRLKELFQVETGLSDHSGEIASGIAAYVLGASAIEVHVTWDREYFGPDTSSSLTFNELSTLVESIRFLQKGLNVKINKNDLKVSHKDMRLNFMKGPYLNTPLKKGEIIKKEDLHYRKPNFGITVDKIDLILGKKLNRDLNEGEPVKPEDFD